MQRLSPRSSFCAADGRLASSSATCVGRASRLQLDRLHRCRGTAGRRQPDLAARGGAGRDPPVDGVPQGTVRGLSAAAVRVDPFHLGKLANDMLTQVGQRVMRDRKGRRARGIVTGVPNARTEAANTGIKHSGRGYRNADNYRARILLASAARTAA
jgi:hypothetical protein